MAGTKTWADGDVVTAADLNGFVRDQWITICTSGTRPTTSQEGRTIYETDTDRYLTWNGTTWAIVVPAAWSTWTTTWTNLTVGNGSFVGRVRTTSYDLTLQGVLYFGTTTSVTGGIGFTVPNAPVVECSLQCAAFNSASSNGWTGTATFSTSTVTSILGPNAVGGWSTTVPFTWGNGSRLYIAGSFPIS